jgi:thiamine kinase-like enzyme
VRIGEVVHRPVSEHAPFVHALLVHLEAVGFDGAPRFRGVDEAGREVLTYLDGEVPHQTEQGSWTDEQLREAARLLRAFHDATAGCALAGAEEVVCHNDFAPWNTVFVAGRPVAVIDFDDACPGPRPRDLSYALWCWLALGAATRDVAEQARRIELMCAAYGLGDLAGVVPEVAKRQQEIFAKHTRNGWIEQARNVAAEIEWLRANGRELVRRLERSVS